MSRKLLDPFLVKMSGYFDSRTTVWEEGGRE
jgi:hypothetical protein